MFTEVYSFPKKKTKEYLWFSYHYPWSKGIYSAKYRTEVVINKNFWNSYLDMRKQGYDDMVSLDEFRSRSCI